MMIKPAVTLLATTLVCSVVFGAEVDEKENPSTGETRTGGFKQAISHEAPRASDRFKWGGDIRLREIYFDNIPTENGGFARGGENHFQRYRFRLWGEYHPGDNLYARVRLVNEFRTGQSGFSYQAWEPMDETVFDKLFIDWKSGQWNIRLGRQDLVYGTGKVILDGTPLDGSRTIYFDAARAIYDGIDNTTVDVFAMYTRAQDQLAMFSQDRDLVGRGGPGYTAAEAGGGIYVKHKSSEKLPWEAYYIIKTKEDDINNPGHTITDPVHTFGTRMMPRRSDGMFNGNLEMAYQSTAGTDAYMVDALASWRIGEEQKSSFGLGWYHLSKYWNPVFARWPQYSELYVYGQADAAGRWSNLSMPHIDLSFAPSKNYKADLLLGYMIAPARIGPGTGNEKGLLFTWWNRFTIKKRLFSQRDKVSAHILVELMKPGGYYTDSQRDEDMAAFIRGEITYSF